MPCRKISSVFVSTLTRWPPKCSQNRYGTHTHTKKTTTDILLINIVSFNGALSLNRVKFKVDIKDITYVMHVYWTILNGSNERVHCKSMTSIVLILCKELKNNNKSYDRKCFVLLSQGNFFSHFPLLFSVLNYSKMTLRPISIYN